MEIELTVWQRVQLLGIVSGARGDLRTLRLALQALDALEFTEDERETTGLVEEAGQVRCSAEAAAATFKLTFEKPALQYLQGVVKTFQAWPVARAQEVFDLLSKLGIEEA